MRREFSKMSNRRSPSEIQTKNRTNVHGTRRIPSWIKAICLAVVCFIGITAVAILASSGNLIRTVLPTEGASFLFLSVGQANCALILTDLGNMMIDTGSNASEEELSAALWYYGVKEIDLLIISHADEDHAGGLDRVLSELSVSRVMLTAGCLRELRGGYSGEALDRAISNEKTELLLVSAGACTTVGEIAVKVLAPAIETEEGGNEASLVVLASYGETDAIYPGDADENGELAALSVLKGQKEEPSVELLLVGHHGSATSSCAEFVEFLSPDYAVISCGKDNSYGHPSSIVIGRLTEVEAEICRTDLSGTVLFLSDGIHLERLR